MSDDVVVGACYYTYAGTMAVIKALGVHVDTRRRGVGSALLTQVLTAITHKAATNHHAEVEVVAWVHKSNEGSQKMLTSDQWVIRKLGAGRGQTNEERDYDVWGTTLAC